mmetsp:Transcript_118182/g.314476  ORF Transcript_118182/g.314476 Transcript_118182/m.314476 type:complete len:345 (-) Transcript_118182:113-1147(-)
MPTMSVRIPKQFAWLTACSVFFPCVLGVRLRGGPAADDSSGPFIEDDSVGVRPRLAMIESGSSHTPSIDRFGSLWSARYRLEEHLAEPMDPGTQLILGVFSVRRDYLYREVVRSTWLRQEGVCYWQAHPRPNCSVYVAFVIGKDSADGDEPGDNSSQGGGEKGMLTLDIAENMNAGKTELWFRTARDMFPWATHVGKQDMDTYPFLHKLLNRMALTRKCVQSIGEYEWIGRPHSCFLIPFGSSCSNEGMYKTQYTSLQDSKYDDVAPIGAKWKFLSGEFYILSRHLVEKVNWMRVTPGRNEDYAVARHVDEAAHEQGFCVVLRRLDSWYHRNSYQDKDYANDLS